MRFLEKSERVPRGRACRGRCGVACSGSSQEPFAQRCATAAPNARKRIRIAENDTTTTRQRRATQATHVESERSEERRHGRRNESAEGYRALVRFLRTNARPPNSSRLFRSALVGSISRNDAQLSQGGSVRFDKVGVRERPDEGRASAVPNVRSGRRTRRISRRVEPKERTSASK